MGLRSGGTKGGESEGASAFSLFSQETRGSLETISLCCGAQRSQHWVPVKKKLRQGGERLVHMGQLEGKKGLYLLPAVAKPCKNMTHMFSTLRPWWASVPMGKGTMLNQTGIHPPLQAGRAATDLGDEGQKIKALRREPQQLHPAGCFPPVTFKWGCWPGTILLVVQGVS